MSSVNRHAVVYVATVAQRNAIHFCNNFGAVLRSPRERNNIFMHTAATNQSLAVHSSNGRSTENNDNKHTE